MQKTIALFIVIMFLLTGCNLPLSNSSAPTPIPISDLLLTSAHGYAPSPTPFQPIPVTPTAGVLISPLPETTQEPETTARVDIDLPRPEGQVNILLLGSDWRPNRGYRTDVIMLLSLIPSKGSATLTSFPRDLYVNIPGIGNERINAAQPYGGFALMQATFQENFDIPVDYYMMTNFYGFEAIINTLGGINVYAAYPLSDECNLPQAVDKTCYVPAGWNNFNGPQALWYLRSRYTTSDFDRTRRAQEVLQAIFQKVMSLDALNRSSELYNLFKANVETDLPLSVIVGLLPLGSQLVVNPSILQRYAISASDTYDYIVPSTGAMVLIPDYDLIANIIKKAVYE